MYIVGCESDPENIKSSAENDPAQAVADAHDTEEVRGAVLVYHGKAMIRNCSIIPTQSPILLSPFI